MTVLVAGHVCLDLTPDLGARADLEPGRLREVGPLRVDLGGCVANTGRALRAAGLPVRVSAAVGDDPLGELVRRLLGDAGLSPDAVQTAPGTATSTSIVVQPTGVDRAFWHHPGANERYAAHALDLDGVDVLHVGYPSLLAALARDDGDALRALFQRARTQGVTTSLDLAVIDPGSPAARVDWTAFLRAVLPHTDIVTPSADDLRSALAVDVGAADLARRAVDWGAGIAAVSDGEAGLSVRAGDAARLSAAGVVVARLAEDWAHAEVAVPAERLERVVTTNGAGDAFSAGLIAAVLRGEGPDDAGRSAARAASAVLAGRTDPVPVLP